MSKRKIIVAGVILLAVVGVAAAMTLQAGGAGVEVEVAEATKTDLAVTVTASGRIVPGEKADVFPPTAGTIADVAVVEGQAVEAGQVLATMDTGSLELAVEQARAGIAAARSQLSAIDKQAPSGADRDAAQAGVEAAWAVYQPARDAYDSLKRVYDATDDAVLKSSMEPSLTALDISRKQAYAGYASAVAARAKTALSLSGERAAANAAVDQANASLRQAQDLVERSVIRAPRAGVVLFNALGAPGADGSVPKAAQGAAVGPQAAIFSVVSLDAVRFAAEVDEVDVARVEKGMRGLISLDAFPGEEISSTVSELSATAQLTATGGTVFPVHFDLKGSALKALIGMKGDVSIEVKAVTGTVSVPIEAIFDEDDEQFVFVIEGGVLAKRKVTTGVLTDMRAEILAGLEAGEEVALSGAVELVDGMPARAKN